MLVVGVMIVGFQQLGALGWSNVEGPPVSMYATTTIPVSAPFDDYEATDRACDRLAAARTYDDLAAEVRVIRDAGLALQVAETCPGQWSRAMAASTPVTTAPKPAPAPVASTPDTTVAPTPAADDGGINAGEAREIKAALVGEYPTVADSVTPMELNQIAQESCAAVAATDTYSAWQAEMTDGGPGTPLTTRMLNLDPTQSEDHHWIGPMLTLSTDRGCHTAFQALLAAKGGD